VVPGCDMAGVVVAKGSAVSKFEKGDKVYGNIQDNNADEKLKQFGTLAEFIVVEENLVAMKPENVSFEEAASLPLAVQTAMEGFKTANFKEGQTVFIVGGAGGVGTLAVPLAVQTAMEGFKTANFKEEQTVFIVGWAGGIGTLAVQLAKQFYRASHVMATTSTPKVEFVKNLGADKVVDYKKTRYEEVEEKFDLLYDTIGDTENSFVVAKDDAPIIDITWLPSNPKATYLGLKISGDNLEKLRQYLESGKLKAVIDPTGPYHFSDVIETFRYLETGRARGKVVISPFPAQYFPSSSCITQNYATFQVVSQVAY
ncbi:2-methylene-furan-3-one reductase-like, partial [Camellia sinensis]|uniref:2-methylene-furan-3-one reductase-like n=1 Tax=Camellia sinensis TaxID=4442 RepID=UPI001035EE95